MKQYHETLRHILDKGEWRDNRTGIRTKAVFGYQQRFDLAEGFPLVTTKKLHLKSIIHELLWFIKGETNIKYLKDNGVRIWDEWADKDGELGPVYGAQWRNFGAQRLAIKKHDNLGDFDGQHVRGSKGHLSTTRVIKTNGVDQLKNVQDTLRSNPQSRRIILSAWNPVDIDKMALPPCHCLFHFNVRAGKYLDCLLYQRSVDAALGLPFNIASYALLIQMMAQTTSLEPGEFIHTSGDLHIYENHMEGIDEQLKRTPKKLPEMRINPDVKDIFDFRYEDFELKNYDYYPSIKFKVAV